MKTKLNFINIFFTFLLITTINSKRFLKEIEEIQAIDTEITNEIIGSFIDVYTNTSNYFSYQISESTSSEVDSGTFSILNPEHLNLDIQCILSTETEVSNVEGKFTENKCKVFSTKFSDIINVIYDISDYKKNTELKLIIKIITKTKSTLRIFFRKEGSYLTDIDSLTKITYSYANIGVKFSLKYDSYKEGKTNIYNLNQEDGILIFTEKKNVISFLDKTSFVIVNTENFAAYFSNYDNVYLFFGKTEYEPASEQLSLTKFNIDTDERLSYYTLNSDTYEDNQISFFDLCENKNYHYLFVNYVDLDNFYLAINNKKGTNCDMKDLDLSKVFDYTNNLETIENNFFSKTNKTYHTFVTRLGCKEIGTNAQLNMKIIKKNENKDDKLSLKEGKFSDIYYKFNSNKNLTINYTKIDEIKIEIFIENEKESPNMKLYFENKEYSFKSTEYIYLKRTKNDTNILYLTCASNSLDAFVSIASGVGQKPLEEGIFIQSSSYYQYLYFYTHPQQFNVQYNITLKIENEESNSFSICYFMSDVPIIQTSIRNCKMLVANSNNNFNLTDYHSKKDNDKFNTIFSPKYQYFIFFNPSFKKFGNIGRDVQVDLAKATPINSVYQDPVKMITLDASLTKNTPKYFVHYYSFTEGEMLNEGHMDIYILNGNITNYEIDLQCIIEAETIISYVEGYFNEKNNSCYIVNKEEKNPKVLHVIFDQKKYLGGNNENLNLILKLKASEDLNIRFFIRKANGEYNVNYFPNNGLLTTNVPQASLIYSLNYTFLENRGDTILYNKEVDGIKIYAKNKNSNNYILIDKGSFILLSKEHLTYKYPDVEKLLVILTKYNNQYSINVGKTSILSSNDDYYYFKQDEFSDDYNLQLKIDNCEEDKVKNVIFNYGKKYENSYIYLIHKVISGELNTTNYLNEFDGKDTLEDITIPLMKNFNKLPELSDDDGWHTVFIKFICKNEVLINFDFFTDTNNEIITLKPGSVYNLINPKGKSKTINYENVNEFVIDLIDYHDKPKFTFEGKEVNFEGDSLLLIKNGNYSGEKTFNFGDILANVTVRISTNANLQKSNINNLYTSDKKYIYKANIGTKNLKFNLKAKTSKKTRRLSENNQTKVCVNTDKVAVLEKSDSNCFYINNSTYDLNYQTPSDLIDDTSYVVIYPSNDDNEIKVNSVERNGVEEEKSSDAKDDEEEEEKKDEDVKGEGDKKDDGSLFLYVWIAVAVVLILVVVAVSFCLIRKKKRITSEDIDKEIREPSEIIQ